MHACMHGSVSEALRLVQGVTCMPGLACGDKLCARFSARLTQEPMSSEHCL